MEFYSTPYGDPSVPWYQRQVHRSRTQGIAGGVLAGIGETYGVNITLLRLIFLLSMMLPGPQLLLYFLAWFLMTPQG
ncbi:MULTISPECIES: PspC domain-containing protein [unclassified Corynebacterium]|uniref:PspC domain-containing protein n=1 Tax=unclassified Corynebacterium TaxID=2624378 RepID=UPI0021673B30|nr:MULTISPECIES: PspC domain-containing protein [unclassified Corynebacterium]MCS4491795.1 PspC domain-containing protein [Corynebacterium sp. ES2715-CONJ3]MCS4531900.1 PspC domain-containing protein [Corynebacterium sp. ES2730-CONJ]